MRVSPLVGLTLGGTFTASGVAMLVCAVVGFADGEAGPAFAVTGAVTTLLGLVLLKTGLDPDRRSIAVTPVGGLLAVTISITRAASPIVEPSNVLSHTKGGLQPGLIGKESSGNDTPGSSNHVNRNSIVSMISTQFDKRIVS